MTRMPRGQADTCAACMRRWEGQSERMAWMLLRAANVMVASLQPRHRCVQFAVHTSRNARESRRVLSGQAALSRPPSATARTKPSKDLLLNLLVPSGAARGDGVTKFWTIPTDFSDDDSFFALLRYMRMQPACASSHCRRIQ